MKTELFDFNLPEALIAQHPIDKRDHSRLLVMNKETGALEHKHFYNIIDELNSNDVLVMNNTKVLPARLIGLKEDTMGKVELLLLENKGDVWQCLTKPSKRIKIGQIISFGNGLLKAKCLRHLGEGIVEYEMVYEGIFLEILDQLGEMPLPPYIHEKLQDKDRYQTVYALETGSAAAPTAGLHFTKDLLTKIKDKGIEIIEVTLHVGLGTFRPTTEEFVEDHHMHKEHYFINQEAANKLNQAVKNKKRIVAVGTTSIRVLESNYTDSFNPGYFETEIFIYPGYQFKVTNALITNFHLPKSTLIMLVSAFSKRELVLNAYQEAIKQEYRFFSFGDAMFIR